MVRFRLPPHSLPIFPHSGASRLLSKVDYYRYPVWQKASAGGFGEFDVDYLEVVGRNSRILILFSSYGIAGVEEGYR